MLVSFSLENFKSFRSQSEISLVAHRPDKTLLSAVVECQLNGSSSLKLLPAAAIYGANASGKSNFVLGLSYMRHAVLNSQGRWQPNTGTRVDLNVGEMTLPARIEAVIIVNGVRYRYGFKALPTHFSEEWLYYYPKGRERLLFDRKTQGSEGNYETEVNVGNSFSGGKRDHLPMIRRTRENSLFLSASAQDNQSEATAIFTWFTKKMQTCTHVDNINIDRDLTSALAHDHENFRALLIPLLRIGDPCIADVVIVKEESNDEFSTTADDDDVLLKNFAKHKVFFAVKIGKENHLMPYESQSRGVKRLYNLAHHFLSSLKFGRVLVVDELESSMHPHVASHILALFQNPSSNPRGAQVVFTTHETRLLNLQHLRRDQVWFCDKDDKGSSLYSLLEFSPRKDENFESGYLRGRYGAVPSAAIDPAWIVAINGKKSSRRMAGADGD